MTNRKIVFFKCMLRPTVVYIIVIYRQPCALHISWYTVHHPSRVGSSLLGQGGYNCFRGVNIPIRGGYINPWFQTVGAAAQNALAANDIVHGWLLL